MFKICIPHSGRPIEIPDRVALRALRAFRTDPGSGCHITTYSTGSHGYGQIGWQAGADRSATTTHRAAWTAVHGQIPLGLTIDHICRVKVCVNVAHLRLLSNVENARDNSQAHLWAAGFGPGGRLSSTPHPKAAK